MTDLSEKKRSFLRELLLRASKKEDDKIIAKMHRDFMLECVPNGKFYKYRSFDKKGYAISNLNLMTIYCSHPSDFNDPFDFQIGNSCVQFFGEKAESDKALFKSVFEKYIDVLFKKINISDCSYKEQQIINKLLGVEILNSFIKNPQEILDNGDEDGAKKIVHAVFEIYISEISPFLDSDSLRSISSRIINEFTIDDYKKPLEKASFPIEEIAEKMSIGDNLDESEKMAGIFKRLNMEKAIESLKVISDFIKRLNSILNKGLLVGCLSTSFDNRLMWSHYAEGHRGFCIEYDFTSIKNDYLPLPVIYEEQMPQFPWELLWGNNEFDITKLKKAFDQCERKNEINTELVIGLMTKDEMWKYEDEWRLLNRTINKPNIEIPITAVYLGAAISEENRTKIVGIAKKQSIPVFQMRIDNGSYKLHNNRIE